MLEVPAMYKCCFCGFVWQPRVVNPRACPNCRRYYNYPKGIIPIVIPGELPKQKQVLKGRKIYSTNELFPCDICGEFKTKLVQIGETKYCGNCLKRLLTKEEIL